MNEIREIVTKAIVAKGKKMFNIVENVPYESKPYSILGVWIINHEFEADKFADIVRVGGEFEVNIWYSLNNNAKTDVLRHKIRYKKEIKTKQIVKDYLENTDDILAKILKHPTCLNAKILDANIEIEIQFEIIAEIVGETKMQVTVFTNEETWTVEDEIDTNIDEYLLNNQ